MGLASALSTALTGLNAAETTIDTVGNNLANSSTNGFKASTVEFATQFLQTQSLGSAPSGSDGGTNPRQVGLGTEVESITPDFSQGTVSLSNNPSDMAIQGNGFFIVQGNGNQQLYTRDGEFKTNSDNELVTATGNKLLGYGVDSNFQIDKSALQSLTIPLGTSAVAQATQNVSLTGTLTPTGDIANTAQILDSGVLGDAKYDQPDTSATTVTGAQAPDITGTTFNASGTGTLNGTYSYKIVDVDAEGNESIAATSAPVTATNDGQVDLTGIPTDSTGSYVGRRIYRTDGTGTGNYYLVGDITDNTTTTFTDTTTDAALTSQPQLNTTDLTGNYTYRITWSAPTSTVPESRPSDLLGPISVTNGRLDLSSLPQPSGAYAGGTINIYRNVAGQPDTYYLVAKNVNPTSGFVDDVPDATLTSTDPTVNPNYQVLNADGPQIQTSTLLTDVIGRDGTSYDHLFSLGTLSFTGAKDGNTLTAKTLQITSTTTVGDLANFMTQALGIQTPGADPHNPIPDDVSGQAPGITVQNGEIHIVSNNGVDNAVSVPLSSFKLTPADGSAVQTPNLGFTATQTAKGQSASTSVVVYDSLGIPLNVHISAVLESTDSSGSTYRWFADSGDNQPANGVGIAVGTGEVKFDGNGNLVSTTNSTVSISRNDVASSSPLQFNLDFSNVSGLAASSSTLNAAKQDGSAPGTLNSYIIGEDGVITGVYSNGVSRSLGQVVLASFRNPEGLEALGNNNYSAGVNSGLPVISKPGDAGVGSITAGAVELSNTDVGKNLIQLILASTAYRGNTRVISTVSDMLQELLALNR